MRLLKLFQQKSQNYVESEKWDVKNITDLENIVGLVNISELVNIYTKKMLVKNPWNVQVNESFWAIDHSISLAYMKME